MISLLLLLLVVLLLIDSINSLIHNLHIENDDRSIFRIESYGFFKDGNATLRIHDMYINPILSSTAEKPNIGLILRKASSESNAQQDLEKVIEKQECLLDHAGPDDFILDMSDANKWNTGGSISGSYTFPEGSEGLYSLMFVRCHPTGVHHMGFRLHADFHNPGPNYLSAGDAPLPFLYFSFFVIFFSAFIVWCWVLTRNEVTNGVVHRIHYLMGVLLLLKCLSLLFEGIRYHYISIVGVAELWSYIYYSFAFLKGMLLFTVILLIGSGWSLMKAYLNDKEKKIILFVLILQVFDNIAMVVIEETAPGSQGWLTWRDVLHLVDIICCCAILFPIIWSIRHLRQAAEADGKAHHNLQKLQLFRQFYIMVVCYIYFTRIIVFLLAATIPFYLLWIGAFFTELATLIFYVVTGYKFKPAVDNPYLPVRSDEGSLLEEEGLEADTNIELISRSKSMSVDRNNV